MIAKFQASRALLKEKLMSMIKRNSLEDLQLGSKKKRPAGGSKEIVKAWRHGGIEAPRVSQTWSNVEKSALVEFILLHKLQDDGCCSYLCSCYHKKQQSKDSYVCV